jgi:hypothetical protein
MKPGTEKVVRRASALIGLNYFIGTLLEYFVDKIRPNLLHRGKKNIVGLWINKNGDPMSNILFKLKNSIEKCRQVVERDYHWDPSGKGYYWDGVQKIVCHFHHCWKDQVQSGSKSTRMD